MNAKLPFKDAGISSTWKRGIIASAAVLALLSASCCVLPIGLSILGLGGAWLALLGPFAAYRSIILLLVAMIVGWAWFKLLRNEGLMSKHRQAWTLPLLLFATVSLGLALSAPYWERSASRTMWEYWAKTP